MIPQEASVQEPATCEFQRLYDLRFRESQEYRRRVWKILTRDFLRPLIPSSSHVLDLGCGWGEFINQIDAGLKYAMDLNPESRQDLRQIFTSSNRIAAPNGHLATAALMWSLAVTSSNIFAQRMICAEPWARSVAVSNLVAGSYDMGPNKVGFLLDRHKATLSNCRDLNLVGGELWD